MVWWCSCGRGGGVRQEKGTVWILCPRDAGVGLVRAEQGSHSWRDDADSLTWATGVWGCPMGVCVKGVALGRCKEQGCSCSRLWDGLGKAGGQRQLKQRGFWLGTVQLPRSRQPMLWWMHTQTFTLATIRRLPGPLFPLERKQGIPLTHWFSSPSLKKFPEMRPYASEASEAPGLLWRCHLLSSLCQCYPCSGNLQRCLHPPQQRVWDILPKSWDQKVNSLKSQIPWNTNK